MEELDAALDELPEEQREVNASYVVVDAFLMDFAPGGTNFPHHHLTAEEIYLVLDGQGDMVAGSGMDGIEGRYPATAGDAYYFLSNCTVGFYNSDRPHRVAAALRYRFGNDRLGMPAGGASPILVLLGCRLRVGMRKAASPPKMLSPWVSGV